MPKILIADDESNILMLLEIMLKDLEAEIITAENGEIAVEKATAHKPDLIITDVVMPKKNGFEVCRSVRNIPEIADTPIIILSALGDEYNKITGFEEGADDYVTKPFNVEELKARAKALLLRHQAKTASLAKAQVQTPPPTEVTEVSPETPTTIKTTTAPTPPADFNESAEAMQIEQISTGITTLDHQLFGGLPKGSNILVLGKLGSGKSSFARNFISEGLKSDKKCLFIAVDDDPKKIRKKFIETLPHTAEHYQEDDLLRFVDAYSWSSLTAPENEPFAVNGILELNQLAGVISDASYEIGQTVQAKLGGRRVIDSISSLLINFELPAVQRFLSQIARTAVAFGGVTTLFLMEEGTVSEQTLNNIKYLMDGVVEFQETPEGRVARIASMKWMKTNSDWVQI